MADEVLRFNGINGATGGYLLPEISAEEIGRLAMGEQLDPEHLNELKWRHLQAAEAHFGVKAGVDATKLSEAGWAAIFAHDADPALREALSELLDHRRAQATEISERRYREFSGVDGYRPGESKQQFLTRHRVGPGSADPDKLPYYLLIVGDPESIPYRFQYQLDVQYAVGRIHFDNLDQYRQYAKKVVQTETAASITSPVAAFVGVRNAADRATQLSADHLVKPLGMQMAQLLPWWKVDTVLEGDATKARLLQLLGGGETPNLVFSASHGMAFPNGDPRQRMHQGALLCQDWPGPMQHRGPIPQDFYLCADDLSEDSRLAGLISFHFACYGAGTPRLDDFAQQAFRERSQIAPQAFVAGLPQRMLNCGALAVIGHVERAWGCSFMWERAGEQLSVFESTLRQLMEGAPVGMAMEFFNQKYAELSSDLTSELEEIQFGKVANNLELAGMWTANNDARSYVIVGDPAVRLQV